MATLIATPEMIRRFKILINNNGIEDLGSFMRNMVNAYLASKNFDDMSLEDRDYHANTCIELLDVFPKLDVQVPMEDDPNFEKVLA